MSLYFDKGANRSLSNLDAAGEEKFTDKQDTLVSGENIKTINGVSVLGEGNIEVGEGGTITVNQTYDPTSSYAQSGTAVADALANSMEAVSQNGTISNCILEIPQNIKLEINSSGNVVVKSGSVIPYPNGTGTYATITLTSDYVTNVGYPTGERYLMLGISNGNPINAQVLISGNQYSGNSAPTTTHLTSYWFDTANYLIKRSSDTGSTWAQPTNGYYTFPLCKVNYTDGIASGFAKDSNGNDMIFNGACFIGHHAIVYPNVKWLQSNGLKDDKTLNSSKKQTSGLYIVELLSGRNAISAYSAVTFTQRTYVGEFDNFEDLPNTANTQVQSIAYIKNGNYMCYAPDTKIWGKAIGNYTNIIGYNYNGTTVTDFTIHQPYEGARNLLTDELEDRVETLETTTPTLLGNNTFTGSNTFGNNTYTSSIVTETYKSKVAEKGVNAPNDNVYLCHYRYTDKNDNVLAHQYFYIPIGTTDVKYILRLIDNTSAGATAYEDVISAKYGANGAEIEIKANKGTFPSLFTSMTGYDASKTQTLKNVNGTLTWVDD